jgi:hypothetical protein
LRKQASSISNTVKKILILLFFYLFCFLKTPGVSAAQPSDVMINEIAWMGTEKSYNDEWIELYNSSSSELNLEGWEIKSEDNKFNIKLTGKILPKGFFILERTDDQSLPDILADLIYKGSLNNAGEHLKLLDKNSETIDEINCQNGWFAGNNKTKQTMERKNSLATGNDKNNWQTSKYPGGTPKKENDQKGEEKTDKIINEKEGIIPGNKQNVSSSGTADYSFKVYINEILPSPEGPDANNEWIEIFNKSDNDINLSGWQIKDVLGKTKSYFFPEKTIIKADDFLVLSGSLTKITLNNDGDSVLLINPKGEITDNVSFKNAPKGKSYDKIDQEWIWSSFPTPGNQNLASGQKTENYNTSLDSVSKEEKIKKPSELKKIASIKQAIPNFNFSFILLIALFLSFLLGGFFLFVKKRAY